MPKSKKQVGESKFWNPEKPGSTVEGTYGGFQKLETEFGGFAILVGEKLVTFSSGIRRALKDKLPKMKEGKDKLKLVFLGQKKTKKKHKFNDISVALNGKLIDTSSFPTLSAKEMLLELSKEADTVPAKKKRK